MTKRTSVLLSTVVFIVLQAAAYLVDYYGVSLHPRRPDPPPPAPLLPTECRTYTDCPTSINPCRGVTCLPDSPAPSSARHCYWYDQCRDGGAPEQ